MTKCMITFLLLIPFQFLYAQETASPIPRPLTIEEYSKAKTFIIADLDKDTYVKFENKYILDRYEMRKPYYITGDDGLKKRIDIFSLVAKDGLQQLGIVIFYTNEKGKLFTAVQPNFTADKKVWEQYFEDIHAIDKNEKNFILKLSYVLSKEMSFQLYKAINAGKNFKEESGTYGSDICFPGDQLVCMADGSNKLIKDISAGEQIISPDPSTNQPAIITVKKLISHEAKNYAVTKLLLVSANEQLTKEGKQVYLFSKALAATPNHPVLVNGNRKKISEVVAGDEMLCMNEQTKTMEKFVVINKQESAGGVQSVYNIEASGGSSLILGGVMVLQK